MIPLFNKDSELVGWLKNNHDHIFDLNMMWVAFIRNNHIWSAKSGNWCGPINGFNCLDRKGKVLAWNPKQSVRGALPPVTPIRVIKPITPIIPIKPITPIKPIKRITPVSGWSDMTFQEWVNQ